MFRKFIKELFECFSSKKILSFCIIGLLLLSSFCCARSMTTKDKDTAGLNTKRTGVRELSNREMVDSVYYLYHNLEGMIDKVDKITQNYQGDSNLLIEKSNHMVSMWLAISTVLVTIVISLSVWNNWKQEQSYKESIEKVKRELEKTAQINKISSIMTCLHCLPDPFMTGDENERKKYVRDNIGMIYDEFVSYSQLVKSEGLTSQNQKYVPLVLSSIKIAVQKSQGIFSDVTSSLCYYTFITKLNGFISEIMTLSPENFNKILDDILGSFNEFRTRIMS